MGSPAEKVDSTEMLGADTKFLAPEDAVSQAGSREQASRLVDDLELLRAERAVSREEEAQARQLSRSKSRHHGVPDDAFNEPAPTTSAGPNPAQPPPSRLNRLWVQIKKFPRFIRYFVYMTPVAVILLTPILLDIYAFQDSNAPVGGPGGVKLMWFGIWLETIWLSLWLARMICAIMPPLFHFMANAAGSSNAKKWSDIGRQLELHTALFLWMLAVLCSYLPILNNTRDPSGDWTGGNPPDIFWIDLVNKIAIALFILATLNIIEKILIQWIATSFHVRTYAYRIEQNKCEIQYLIQLYEYCRNESHGNLPWDAEGKGAGSGARTPLQAFQENARHVWGKVGNAANRIAGDFTGRKILHGDHPQKVVLELLRTTASSHTLARMIYRTFVRPEHETITPEDLGRAFSSPEEAEACFGTFDKDLNGDISMEELEIVCNEIHLEKKAIAASLKDLDSVIKKLDKVFLFVIIVIAAIVFVSIISNSAAAALGSAGTTILGLAWMLQATAQEFLQSIIFVFVKHPFDVGDRVTVYGNTGSMMRGDDYYVQEISLLYTEFKKMEGHIVQAPNSLLNDLFILNQRRSNGLADPIQLKVRFGTPNSVIEELKARMSDFVLENKRDYGPRIITEVTTIEEVWSVTINFIFFHKSNFQNELQRLQRHNKFATELMRQMEDLGIEGPRKMQPGGMRDYPFYWSNVQPPEYSEMRSAQPPPPPSSPDVIRRRRAESRAAIIDSGPDFQDVYDSRRQEGVPRLHSIRGPPNRDFSPDNRLASPIERAESRGSGRWQRHRTFPRQTSNPANSNNMV